MRRVNKGAKGKKENKKGRKSGKGGENEDWRGGEDRKREANWRGASIENSSPSVLISRPPHGSRAIY